MKTLKAPFLVLPPLPPLPPEAAARLDTMKAESGVEPWNCIESDRPRYLRWVWEVSHLPWLFVALGECRDAHRLKLARSWKKRMEEWCRRQIWLQDHGNSNAWEYNIPTRARFLSRCGVTGTEDDIEDGLDLMNEIGHYGISDEYQIIRDMN